MIEFVIFMLKQQDPSTPSLYQLKRTLLPGYIPPQLVSTGTCVIPPIPHTCTCTCTITLPHYINYSYTVSLPKRHSIPRQSPQYHHCKMLKSSEYSCKSSPLPSSVRWSDQVMILHIICHPLPYSLSEQIYGYVAFIGR